MKPNDNSFSAPDNRVDAFSYQPVAAVADRGTVAAVPETPVAAPVRPVVVPLSPVASPPEVLPQDNLAEPMSVTPGDALETESVGIGSGGELSEPEVITGDEVPPEQPDPSATFSPFRYNRTAFLITGAVIVIVLLIGAGSWLLSGKQHNGGNGANVNNVDQYATGSDLKLNDIRGSQQLEVGQAETLTVNGELKANNTFVVAPTSRPQNPSLGQIYYDKVTNAPYYYNGQEFVSLAPQGGVTSLGGTTGPIGVGGGLVVTGGQLSINSSLLQQITASAAAGSNTIGAYVASLQGQSGNVTLTAGSGISINGTAISNSGVVGLASGSPNLTVTSDGNGHYTVSAATASGISGTGTPGAIPKFDGPSSIADSHLSESGTTLTYAGNVVVNTPTGFGGNLLNLEVNGSSQLTVDQNGGTVMAGDLHVNGTGSSMVAGSLSVGTGLSVTTGGANITGNSTVNGQLSGLTGLTSAGTITFSGLNSAGVVHTNASGTLSTAPVVLGTDTSGDYVAGLGALTGLSTTGNSGSAATPTLAVNYGSTAGTSVQGNTTLTCASGTGNLSGGGNGVVLGSGGACGDITITNSPTFTGTLVAAALQGDGSGVTNVDAVSLQSHDASYFTDASNLASGTLSDSRLSTNVARLNGANNFTGATLQHNGNDVCDNSNNCNYASASGSGSYIWNGVAVQAGANFNIGGNGVIGGTLGVTGATTLSTLSVTSNTTIGGTLGVTGTSTFTGQITANGGLTTNNANINTGTGTINGASITSTTFNTATITGGSLTGGSISGGTITSGSLSSTAVNNLGLTSTAITAPGAFSLSAGGTNQDLSLQGSGTGSVIVQTPTFHNANGATYSFNPADAAAVNATICTTVGNCAGAGGGITGSGTAGQIAFFNGTGSIASDSGLTYGSGNLTASGTIAAASLQGNSLSLGTAGPSGTTGSIVFKNAAGANTVTLQGPATNPLSNLIFTLPAADGSNGQCLQTNGSGALAFGGCTGGAGGGVTSVNGLTGVLTLDNASGSGSHITIDNASTSQKGIAQFNGTNFTDNGAGVINTIQDIAIGAAPTFSGLTLSGLNTAGVVHTSSTGVLSTGIVVLGAETSGNYVANLGALTGLTITGNTGAGSTPTLSVAYGATANTAVQGNTAITCTGVSGSNLSGGGNNVTLGSGGSCNSISLTNSPTFSGTLTVQGAGGITVGVAGGTAGKLTLATTGTGSVSLVPVGAQTGSYTISIPTLSANDTLCLATLSNCSAAGAASGDLSGSYPAPKVVGLNGTPLALSSLSNGDVLQYNGTNWINGQLTNNSFNNAAIYSNITGVGALTSGSIGGSFGTIATSNGISTTSTLQGGTVNIGSSNQLQIDASGNLTTSGTAAIKGAGGLTLGVAGNTAGVLKLANGLNNNLSILQSAAPTGTGDATYTLPSIAGATSDEICLKNTGNCAGVGGIIGGSGTAGHLAVFTNGTTIGSSNLTESGTTLTYGGNVVVNAASGFSGNLINLEVNGSSKLSVDQVGNSVQAGTLTVNSTGASSIAGTLNVGTLGSGGTTALCSNAGTIGTCASTGTINFWNRTSTTLQPANAGDSITTSGNISTTGSGGITASGILSANATGKTAISIADSGAQNSGITIGGDTNLYRGGNNLLKTDDSLQVAANLGVGYDPTTLTGGAVAAFNGNVAIGSPGASNVKLWVNGGGTGALQYRSNATIQAITANGAGAAGVFATVTGGSSDDAVAIYGTTVAGNVNAYAGRFDGKTLVQSDSTMAFQIQDSLGNSILQADTSNKQVNIGIGTPGTTGSTSIIIPPSGGGKVGTWQTATNSLPTALFGATSVAYNGYIYEIGGTTNSTTAVSTVYYAPLNADGSVGAWVNDTSSPLPASRSNATSVVYNGYVYVFGGSAGGTTAYLSVYYAPLNADGSVGTWKTSAQSLPFWRRDATAVVNNGYVYVMGGSDGTSGSNTNKTTIYYAQLNPSTGDVGAWQTNPNPLPIATAGATSVVNNGYIYEIGGSQTSNTCSTSNTNQVYYAPINGDGTVGSWVSTNSMIYGRFGSGAVAWGGYVYNLSGTVTGGSCSYAADTQLYAGLNADGTVTSWSDNYATTQPYNAWQATAVAYNGYMYQLGGTTNGTSGLTTIQYTSVSGNQGYTIPSDGSPVVGTLNSVAQPLGNGPGNLQVTAGANTGGSLIAQNYYYKVTAVAPDGPQTSDEKVVYKSSFAPAISAPATAPTTTVTATTANYIYCNATYPCSYKVTYMNSSGETTAGPATAAITNDTGNFAISLTNIPTGPAGTVARALYVYEPYYWGSNYRQAYVINDNTTTSITDQGYSYWTGSKASPPETNTASTNTNNVNLSWNAVSGATDYNIYRGTSPGQENVLVTTTTNTSYTDTGTGGTSVDPSKVDSYSAGLTVQGSAFIEANSASTGTTFQVQDSTGHNLLSVNNALKRVVVGSASSTPTVLILGTKNTLGDPTCVSGGMYYNSSTNQAKVCLGGNWAAMGVPTVTSLPANPSDGDEVYYQVYVNGQLSGNTGYWHLRYNASTGYWDFLGGPALYSLDPTMHTTASTSYVGSSAYAYLPLNGDYDITYGSQLVNDAANSVNQMQVGLSQNTTAIHTCYFIAPSQFVGSSLSCSYRLSGVTGAGGAAQYVRDNYLSLQGQSANFYPMFVGVTPIRVK